jgi:NAD(P)-dependent dehydrogenase (short-subunit alcohol dehydrogenase family)
MFDFSGKVVLITGGTGNVGCVAVRRFHQAGARLAVLDRNPDEQKQLFPELANSDDHLLLAPVNLMSAQETARAAQQIVDRLGRIDVLVNTVGGYRAGTPLHETDPDVWNLMMNLNAGTVFNMCRAVIPHMLAEGSGKIISFAARAGLQGGAEASAYAASKAAVIRATESMAAELRTKGINVNCVLPSIIDTEDNRAAMPKADFSRWVTPDSITDVIMFLASDAARDIHGAAIPVYGRS